MQLATRSLLDIDHASAGINHKGLASRWVRQTVRIGVDNPNTLARGIGEKQGLVVGRRIGQSLVKADASDRGSAGAATVAGDHLVTMPIGKKRWRQIHIQTVKGLIVHRVAQ